MAMFAKKREAKIMKTKSKVGAVNSGADLSANDTSSSTANGSGAPKIAQVEPQIEPTAVAEAALKNPVVTAGVGGANAAASAPQTGSDDTGEGESEAIDPDMIETLAEINAPEFGIADAIRLMRSLPTDSSADLLVRVVRLTLGAVNVSVDDILLDAGRKERAIKENIVNLRRQADELENQLRIRLDEIAAQDAELRETVIVRERLRQYAGHRPPPTPSDAARGARPTPRERSPA